MTSTTEDIYSRFYLAAEDYEMKELAEELVDEILKGLVSKVIAKPYVRRLFRKISFDQDVGEVEYTMRNSWDEGADQEFVEEMIALGMLSAWVSPKYYNTLNTSQYISNSEKKLYPQANHMAELRAMSEKAEIEFRKFIRDRGYALGYVNSE